MSQVINFFMWGYQTHFHAGLEFRAKRVFEKLGAEVEPKVLLVGLRRAERGDGHPVCIEPEDGEWHIALFESLGADVEKAIPTHPLQRMFYGDERSMREKPTHIRQQTIANEVQRRLGDEDRRLGKRSFCSEAYPVDDYNVVCVLQLPSHLFDRYPSIEVTWQGEPYKTSLVHACIQRLLDEGRRGLALPEPGRSYYDDGLRSAEEIICLAASSFMHSPFLAGWFCMSDLFEDVNRVSQVRYEGLTGIGSLVLAAADDPNIEYVVRLASPVALSKTR